MTSSVESPILIESDNDSDVEILREDKNEDLDLIFVSETIHVKEEDKSVNTDVGFNRSLSISSNLDLTLRLNDNPPVVPVIHTSLTSDNKSALISPPHPITSNDVSAVSPHLTALDLSSKAEYDDITDSSEDESSSSLSSEDDPFETSESDKSNTLPTTKGPNETGSLFSMPILYTSTTVNSYSCTGTQAYNSLQGTSTSVITDSSNSANVLNIPDAYKQTCSGFCSQKISRQSNLLPDNNGVSSVQSDQFIDIVQTGRNISNNLSVQNITKDNQTNATSSLKVIHTTNSLSLSTQNRNTVSGGLQNPSILSTSNSSTSIYTNDNTATLSQNSSNPSVITIQPTTTGVDASAVSNICDELLKDLDFLSNTSPPKSDAVSQGIKRSLSEQTQKSKTEDKVLPPKKQIRYFLNHQMGEESCSWGSEKCSLCQISLLGLKKSRCLHGHPSCSTCLEEKVKVVLTGKAKETLHCLKAGCDSYFPLSELNQSLPKMVVDILETKLDDDYIEYISSMILKNATSSNDGSDNVDAQQVPVIPESSCHGDSKQGSYKDLPENWSTMDWKKTYEMVVLEAETQEYLDVVFKFHETLKFPDFDIVKVFRIQNPILWQYYSVKRSQMIQENEGINVEERRLFHGTQSSVVDSICKKGFDWRVCGKNGTVYGQGSYFAVNASYSHQYTDRPNRRQRTLKARLSNIMPTPPPAHTGSQSRLLAQRMYFMNRFQYSQPGSLNNIPSSMMMPTTPQPYIVNNASIPQNGVIISPQTMPLNGQPANFIAQNPTLNTSQPSNFIVQGSGQQMMPNLGAAGQPSYGQPQVLYQPLTIPVMDVQERKAKHKMILSRVLVGRYTGGKADLRKPPPLFPEEDVYGKCYDSCVDQIQEPKIFVIFDSAQAYPEYLIEYHFND